jgi:hypothetical protein
VCSYVQNFLSPHGKMADVLVRLTLGQLRSLNYRLYVPQDIAKFQSP